MTRNKRLAAEALGTAMLLAMVVGSSIVSESLAGGNAAIALLAKAMVAGCGLASLILAFGDTSGAHFNPLVTLSETWRKKLPPGDAPPYITAQTVGAFAGVAVAHWMFGEPAFSHSLQVRTGATQWLGEFVASFGLLVVTIGCSRSRPGATPFAVAAYLATAFWFTSSGSFANPALTLARAATNTSAGIRLDDVAGFIIAQLLGAAAATGLFCWLYPAAPLSDPNPSIEPAAPVCEASRSNSNLGGDTPADLASRLR